MIKKAKPKNTTGKVRETSQRKIDGVKRHREWQRSLNKNVFFNKVFSAKGA
jgi:hypothetical protein